MHQPASAATHVQYADVLYTIGGAANYQTARTHYSAAIEISSGRNARALYGLCATSAQLRKGDSRVRHLKHELSSTILPIAKPPGDRCPSDQMHRSHRGRTCIQDVQQTCRRAPVRSLSSQAKHDHFDVCTAGSGREGARGPCRAGRTEPAAAVFRGSAQQIAPCCSTSESPADTHRRDNISTVTSAKS